MTVTCCEAAWPSFIVVHPKDKKKYVEAGLAHEGVAEWLIMRWMISTFLYHSWPSIVVQSQCPWEAVKGY